MAQLPPAGWHPDPLGRHAQRYWDGQQWTEHVADQAGNMSTDPLDGGGQAQQAQQAATTPDSTQDSTSQGSASWGTESDDSASWGTESGGGAQWGAEATDTTTGAHGEPAEAEQAPAGGFESAWGAAAGGAAVAGTAAAASSEPEHTASLDTAAHDDTTDSATGVDASSGPAGEDDEDGQAWPTGVLAFEVDDADPILAVPSAIVARQPGVTATEAEDGDHLAGSGTVWLGGAGRDVTVVTLQSPGLTIDRAALVAHSAGLSREDAHPGIVGFAGVRLSGAGWVALAAAGGLTEIPVHGGVEVASNALVAFTNDVDVSHADTVSLSGAGVALVSGG